MGALNEWHDYEIEWTPDYIKWTVDGSVKRIVYAGTASVNFTNKAQHLMMNFWTPTFYPWNIGRQNYNMPWYALYDYVEVWNYNQTTKSFEFNFRDDFTSDYIDTSRWYVSDGWTFESNDSLFLKSQVYQANGYMCLQMKA